MYCCDKHACCSCRRQRTHISALAGLHTEELLGPVQHCSIRQISCGLAAGVVALPATSSFPGMASAAGSSPGRKPTFFATGGEKGQLKIWQADSGEL